MRHSTLFPVALAALLLASVAGLAAQGFDRADRARLRAEIRREIREAAWETSRERSLVRDEIRRDLDRARHIYRDAFRDQSRARLSGRHARVPARDARRPPVSLVARRRKPSDQRSEGLALRGRYD